MFSVMAHFLQIQSIFVRTFLGARSYPDSIVGKDYSGLKKQPQKLTFAVIGGNSQ